MSDAPCPKCGAASRMVLAYLRRRDWCCGTSEIHGHIIRTQTCELREKDSEIERLQDRLRNIEHCARLVCDSWEKYGDVGVTAFAALRATLSIETETIALD